MPKIPRRQIRAVFNDNSIRVYQAYADPIAEVALSKGTFRWPFKLTRMTWIKPSFLWMMYRSGWGLKEGQNRILSIDITREGFEWALLHGCLSHYRENVHTSKEEWRRQMAESPVRIQWDPERTITLEKEDYYTIQIGLSAQAIKHYINDWILSITEITDIAKEINARICSGAVSEACLMLPCESVYPVPSSIAAKLGMD